MAEDFKDKPRGLEFRWRLDIDYMMPYELQELARLRRSNLLSFFKTKTCALEGCEIEIISDPAKLYCCEAHKFSHETRLLADKAAQANAQALSQAKAVNKAAEQRKKEKGK